MPREFLLPELAESVVEGEIVRWLVAEGETVAEDQPIVEVMTDKVTVELPSPFAGVLRKHLAAEGDVVEVHRPIALFADDEEAAEQGTAPAGGGEASSAGSADGARGKDAEEDDGDRLSLFRPSREVEEGPALQVRREAGARARGGPAGSAAATRPSGPYGRVLAVPAARRLARELGVDIERVAGSGPNGRVRVEDVRSHADGEAARPQAEPRPGATRYVTPAGYQDLEERVPVRGLRRAISQQMVASHLQSVRTLHVDEADLTSLVAMRSRLKPVAEKRGVKVSYLPFIMKATVAALKAFPMLNASLDEEAGEIVRKRYYNLGLAVATDSGLVVPVVHDVDRKSLLELAEELQSKARRAREGKLETADVKGGSFSITNIGSLGGLFSFPIINVPEAAILGVHSIKKRPVVLEDDTIAARQMLYLSLSFDHRLVDGAEAAMFTSHLIELLETPESLLLEI
jgi:2-oxoisovalerate dehydrogenase E2 component (dihydrolipoyl transacylase)